MQEFWANHFDAFITGLITIAGFVVTYFLNRKTFRDEVKKDKISRVVEEMSSLPFEICCLLNSINEGTIKVEQYSSILSKVMAYGSKDAISIAVKIQQISYELETKPEKEKYILLAGYCLLLAQVKADMTTEIVSPESWLQIKIRDYDTIRDKMKSHINELITELHLDKKLMV